MTRPGRSFITDSEAAYVRKVGEKKGEATWRELLDGDSKLSFLASKA